VRAQNVRKCKEEIFLPSLRLTGRGPFITGKLPDNY
jgi:hypothetical protein